MTPWDGPTPIGTPIDGGYRDTGVQNTWDGSTPIGTAIDGGYRDTGVQNDAADANASDADVG